MGVPKIHKIQEVLYQAATLLCFIDIGEPIRYDNSGGTDNDMSDGSHRFERGR